MKLPKIIQGGMGISISNWKLAKAVSKEGELGVVSGTGIPQIITSQLMEGDRDGTIRWALSHFPFQEPVQRLLEKYFDQESETMQTYKRPPMWTLNPSKTLNEITVISNFVEVFLAKAGHKNFVGLNLLEKIQMPTMASLYGAMLAGVNFVIMGAGIPLQVPGILDKLANHHKVSYRIDVQGSTSDDNFRLDFDPKAVFSEAVEKIQNLTRPYFLPVISSVVLAKSLIRRSSGKVNGFIVEENIAGGHNAPPRGAMRLDENGEPIYGTKDTPDLNKIRELGLPFWLAGGYDSPEKLQEAQELGATGVQIGTAFAFCNESGMEETARQKVMQKVLDKNIVVRTDSNISPTGYPFKVVQIEGTMSDPDVYNERVRLCDIGLLREPYKGADQTVGYRCSAEPEEQYLKKEGEPDPLAGKGCLCNNLCAIAGYPQRRKNGFVEKPVITSGDGLVSIGKFLKSGNHSYSVKDVLDYLLGKTDRRKN